jgi:DNA-binding transcriptional ArsR family regulator
MSGRSHNVVQLDGCAVRTVDAPKVAAVRAALPAEPEVSRLAEVFALLGDPSRLRILTALAEAGELCVCDVAATVGMTESAASHALRLLRSSRVVEPRRAGKMTFYRLADAHVRVLIDVALSHVQHTTADPAGARR